MDLAPDIQAWNVLKKTMVTGNGNLCAFSIFKGTSAKQYFFWDGSEDRNLQAYMILCQICWAPCWDVDSFLCCVMEHRGPETERA